MAAKRYMVDLPDPSRPGEYYSEGPLTRSEVPEAAIYTAVFAKHPGQGGAR